MLPINRSANLSFNTQMHNKTTNATSFLRHSQARNQTLLRNTLSNQNKSGIAPLGADEPGPEEAEHEYSNGIMKSFKAGGFDFFINFDELSFDTKNDFVGGGGYGDVY